MPSIREYPQATSFDPTDALVLDRVATGTMFIEGEDFFPPSTTFDTLVAAEAATIPATYQWIAVLGYYTSSDGGDARWSRTTAGPAAGKRQFNDGNWWILTTKTPNDRMLGSKANGSFNDRPACQELIDFCFGPATSPNGANAFNNLPLRWVGGRYTLDIALKYTSVRGADIEGSGRFSTAFTNTAGGICWDVNGLQYSRIIGVALASSGTTATVLNIDWTGTGLSTQSNSWYDIFVSGGDKGIVIGLSGLQASEQSFFDCFVGPVHTYGITVNNFNALGNNFYGGNIQSCPTGMRAFAGTINFYGTGFQGSTVFDIQFDSSANDAVEINGIRTESINFLFIQNGMTAHVAACSQLAGTNGWFVKIEGTAHIAGCVSTKGQVGFAAKGSVEDCVFGRADAIGPFQSASYLFRVKTTSLNGVIMVDRTYTDLGGGAAGAFPSSFTPTMNSAVAIPAGGGLVRIAIPPNVRISSLWLDIDTAGAAGTVDIGDDSSSTLYFGAQALNAAGHFLSATARTLYAASNEIKATSTASSGLVATLNVYYTFLN